MLINGKKLDTVRVNSLVKDITKKKELAGVQSDFVKKQLLEFLKRDEKASRYVLSDKFSVKAKEYKRIVKGVRARLRRYHSLFAVGDVETERLELFSELLKEKDHAKAMKIIVKLLETHSSTKERLPFYSQFYKKLFKITGEVNSVLDLGSGLNPLSIIYANLIMKNKFHYYAYEINKKEVEFLNKYFTLMKKCHSSFIGKAENLDLTKVRALSKLPQADVCFLFKMTDVLEQGRGHKVTEQILQAVKAKFVVVSFPTLTMSGKRMNYPRRRWMELMCERLGWSYSLIEMPNELFYVVMK
jgi:hypothetical protein